MSWKPYEGGIEIEHAIKMDPAGMIPGFLKNKAASFDDITPLLRPLYRG